MSVLTPVKFLGANLYASRVNGVPYVAIEPICDALSIQWMPQYRRIKSHPVLSTGMRRLLLPSGGQPVVCLPLAQLNGWLFGVTERQLPDNALLPKLIEYQCRCFDALLWHFFASAKPALVAMSMPGPGQWDVSVGPGGVVSIKRHDSPDAHAPD
jgi:hypothetical protein